MRPIHCAYRIGLISPRSLFYISRNKQNYRQLVFFVVSFCLPRQSPERDVIASLLANDGCLANIQPVEMLFRLADTRRDRTGCHSSICKKLEFFHVKTSFSKKYESLRILHRAPELHRLSCSRFIASRSCSHRKNTCHRYVLRILLSVVILE